MLLAELVSASDQVAATAARSEKSALLADLLARATPEELPIAVGFLIGVPRQGRIGVGWSALVGAEVTTSAEPSLTLGQLDTAIDELEATTGPGSQASRRAQLSRVLGRATDSEQTFVRRLFTGDLRQGALEGVVTEAVAKASGIPAALVRRATMLSGDLGQVAAATRRGRRAVEDIGLEVGRAVKPMLASTAADVAAALVGFDLASVEWKLDGIRVQIHRRDDDIRVYTRNLNDVTDHLPTVVGVVASLPCTSIVLDAEAAAPGDPAAFQDLMSAFGRDDAPAVGLVPFVFDLLHVDGIDLLDQPLVERIPRLAELVPEHRMPGTVTADVTQAEQVLVDALAAGHEGVVVKDANSAYVAGRRGKAWRKVKPHHTLDLVVLGAEWGHGRRRGWLSNLHLGAKRPEGGFVMVGKTFKGLTDELLAWQTREIQAREQRSEGITVFARPELVVEIALDGVQSSTRYPGGVALRFARVKRYRTDKSPDDTDTIDAVRGLLPGGASDD